MFMLMTSLQIHNALQHHSGIDDFPGPCGWLSDMQEGVAIADKLLASNMRIPSLLARAKSALGHAHTSETTLEVAALLDEALSLERALSEWDMQMPYQWAYRSVTQFTPLPDNVECAESWPGPIHVYQSRRVAGIRNTNRVSQLLCSSAVIDALAWLDSTRYMIDERYSHACWRIQSLVDEICACVPFILTATFQEIETELVPERDGTSFPGLNWWNNADDTVVLDRLNGYNLIWPIHVASDMHGISEVQKRWLRGRLAAIAKYYGLEPANILSARNRGKSGANWAPLDATACA